MAVSLYGSSEALFAIPYGFQIDKEQRLSFYPLEWEIVGKFNTLMEFKDGNIIDENVIHSYSLYFEISLINENLVNITLDYISPDDIGEGNWLFDVEIYTLNETLLDSFLNFTSPGSLIIPELEGYKFHIFGEYRYLSCLMITGSGCDISGEMFEYFYKDEILEFNTETWEELKKGYMQLIFSSYMVIMLAIFTLEYYINFKERSKKNRIIVGTSYGFTCTVGIYSLITIFSTLMGKGFSGFTSHEIIIVIVVALHYLNTAFESTRKVSSEE